MCILFLSLFFFNLSNQFGSYSISDHDDEFNITTKKTRMVHIAHFSQLSTITIKIMTHTGKSGPFFCVDISFLSSSSSFSLDNNALACSARSLALCLAYIFFTCSTPALLELFSSTNFWETWDKAAFSLKSRVIWGCFGSIYQIYSLIEPHSQSCNIIYSTSIIFYSQMWENPL